VGVDASVHGTLSVELELGTFARYYLWKGLHGELGLGYHWYHEEDIIIQEQGTELVNAWRSGVAISPGVGWKFDPGEAGGFFIEPGISVPITIGQKSISGDETGVSAGFLVYFGFGGSF
jgi:hypothetical protein